MFVWGWDIEIWVLLDRRGIVARMGVVHGLELKSSRRYRGRASD